MMRRVFLVGRRRPWRRLTQLTVAPKEVGGADSQADTARERLETTRTLKLADRPEAVN